MRLAQAILIILLFFFTIAFCLQNVDAVTLHYYGLVDNLTAPVFVVVLASVFLGIIIGIIGGGLTTIRLRLQLRRKTKEAGTLQKELASLQGEDISEPEFSSFTTTDE
ncbi:MAG: LapA family protein [Deltaproteobacteria bacterium]